MVCVVVGFASGWWSDIYCVVLSFDNMISSEQYNAYVSCVSTMRVSYRDMDEWSFALLSCKVFIKSFLADQRIYHKGETSDYAYVVLGGSVTVSNTQAAINMHVLKNVLCLYREIVSDVQSSYCCLLWATIFGIFIHLIKSLYLLLYFNTGGDGNIIIKDQTEPIRWYRHHEHRANAQLGHAVR